MRPRRRLRARDRRALFVALVVLGPLTILRVAVPPWLQGLEDRRDLLLSERDLYAREVQALYEAVAAPEQERTLVEALEGAQPWLLEGDGILAASGNLSRLIAELGRDTQILIQEAATRETAGVEEEEAPITEVLLSVRAQGDLEGLVRFLHELENGPLLTRVDQLSLTTAGINDGDTERGQLMTMSLLVCAFWLEGSDAGLHVPEVESEGRP